MEVRRAGHFWEGRPFPHRVSPGTSTWGGGTAVCWGRQMETRAPSLGCGTRPVPSGRALQTQQDHHTLCEALELSRLSAGLGDPAGAGTGRGRPGPRDGTAGRAGPGCSRVPSPVWLHPANPPELSLPPPGQAASKQWVTGTCPHSQTPGRGQGTEGPAACGVRVPSPPAGGQHRPVAGGEGV